MKNLPYILLGSALALGLGLLLWNGLDAHIAQQDKMLCQSALESGNKEWQNKCYCYYVTGQISCIQYER